MTKLSDARRRAFSAALLFGFAAVSSLAQTPPQANPQTPPRPLPLPSISPLAVVPQLQGVIDQTTLGDAVRAQAQVAFERGVAENRDGKNGDAWQSLTQARAIALGTPWTVTEQFASSLNLLHDSVTDASRLLVVRLVQRPVVQYQAQSQLRLHPTLIAANTTRAVVRDYGYQQGIPLDLIAAPFGFTLDLAGVEPGQYLVSVVVEDGARTLTRIERAIWVVDGLDAKASEVRRRAAAISGHEETKARILYPFDIARTINIGSREPAYFDYKAEIERSFELLKALESGKDPLYQATGDLKKAYWLADAAEVMGYRVYVPTKWKPGMSLPMMVHLHGLNNDENNAFEPPKGTPLADAATGLLAKAAEQRGYIVVSPLGYRPASSWGGSRTFLGQQWTPKPGDTIAVPDPARQQVLAFAEKDLFSVIDLVTKEYGVDPKRIFLNGNSAGAGGVLYYAGKYPEKWAAIAPTSSPYHPVSHYPYERYKRLPVLMIHASNDPIAYVKNSRVLQNSFTDIGVDSTLIEVPGLPVPLAHSYAWYTKLPEIFDFFDKHGGKR